MRKKSEQQIKESIKNQPTIERIVDDETNNNSTVFNCEREYSCEIQQRTHGIIKSILYVYTHIISRIERSRKRQTSLPYTHLVAASSCVFVRAL